MAQFVQVQEKDLGAGIDRLSAESSVPEGFSQKLVNWEPTPEGYLSKREGYTVFGGRLPLRMHSTPGGGTIVFNPEVSLADLTNTPILVGGYNNSGTWSTVYTSDYSTDPRLTLTTTTPVSFTSQQTGLTSPNSSIQIWEKHDYEDFASFIPLSDNPATLYEIPRISVSESVFASTIRTWK